MVSETLTDGGILFVGGLGAIVLGYIAAYAFHVIRHFDESATKTLLTETLHKLNGQGGK